VRLGIKAPKEIPIHRQEVHDAIHAKSSETTEQPKPANP
jgi:carbon storage regulator CsrA